jgi:hypothetical protein
MNTTNVLNGFSFLEGTVAQNFRPLVFSWIDTILTPDLIPNVFRIRFEIPRVEKEHESAVYETVLIHF